MSFAEAAAHTLVVPPPRRVVDLPMSDGALVRLRQYGSTGRPRLVLSHGNGLAIDAYLPFWLSLADEFELVLFDIRNHGENPVHAAAHDWDRFARDMDEVIVGINAHFGDRPNIGVFHSLSAVVALLHELGRGPVWAALALFEPPLYPPPGHPLQPLQQADMDRRARLTRQRIESFISVEKFAEQLARQPAFGRWVPGMHLLFAQATLQKSTDGKWVLRNPRELEARIYETNIDATIWPRLRSLACPVVLIGGDPACPHATPASAACRAIHEEFGVAYTMIPDTTHFLQIEQPEACRRALKDFIAGLN